MTISLNKKLSVIHFPYSGRITEEHIESLTVQKMKECAFVFLTDSRTDPSVVNMIWSCSKNDSRIKMIHSDSASQNMTAADGEYVLFSEGHEIYAPDFFETVCEKADQTKCDIVLMEQAGNDLKGKELFSRKDIPDSILTAVSPKISTKLFRRSFLDQHPFLTGLPQSLSGSAVYSETAVCLAESITYLSGSDTAVSFPEQKTAGITEQNDIFNELYGLFHSLKKNSIYDDTQISFLNYAVKAIADAVRSSDNEALLKEKIYHFIKETNLLNSPVESFHNQKDYMTVKSMYSRYLWTEKRKQSAPDKSFRIVHDRSRSYQPAVSVIIPIYNSEKYLKEGMDSVMHQSFSNIEIICVDDGSVDDSLKIAEELAATDERIIVCTQKNQGLSTSRNNGIRIAEGEYLLYHDSDDLLTEDALETLYSRMSSDGLDLLLFDGKRFIDDLPEEYEDSRDLESYLHYYDRKQEYSDICTGTQLMYMMRNNGDYRPNACLQMIRREFFLNHQLWFLHGILHEDNLYTFRCHLYAQKAGHINRQFSLRRAHSDSIMTTKKSFGNVYGYYVCYVKGSGELAVCEDKMTDEEITSARNVLAGMLGNARNIYSDLPENEKNIRKELKSSEQEYFKLLIEDTAKSKEYQKKLKAEQKRNSELNAKLQQTYKEKSELNNKLQQTYKEKSELNAKLQQTYKEKAERGERIKELENESLLTTMKRKIRI